MNAAPAQLVLRFPRTPGYGADDLLPNAAQMQARAWLDGTEPWPLHRLAVWGAVGSGKTHLAHAWAERRNGTVLSAAPASGYPRGPVAVDSIDRVPDEPALLHLLNAAAEAGHPVLLVSTGAPGRLPVRLPDLASRLRATTAVPIGGADERFLALLLTRLLSERQLRLPSALQAWLLARLPRNPAAIGDAVARLDAAALTAGRAINRPMAAALLGFRDNAVSTGAETSPLPPDVG